MTLIILHCNRKVTPKIIYKITGFTFSRGMDKTNEEVQSEKSRAVITLVSINYFHNQILLQYSISSRDLIFV